LPDPDDDCVAGGTDCTPIRPATAAATVIVFKPDVRKEYVGVEGA
jgi:hypothetical protein